MSNCILLITNNGYEDMTKVCLYSLLEHIDYTKVDILLYVDGPCSIYNEFKDKVKVKHIDYKLPITLSVSSEMRKWDLDLISHRISLLDELKYNYDKILLLDTDTLIIDDFSELFELEKVSGYNCYDLHKSYTDMVGFKPIVNPKQPNFYLNCGVTLLPSKILKKFNLMAEYLKELYIRGSEYTCPEQDFFNCLFSDKFDFKNKYNYMLTNKGKFESKIIHYVSTTKPTKVDFVSMIMDYNIYLLYYNYIEKYRNNLSTGFCSVIEEKIKEVNDFINTNNIKSIMRV